MFSRSREGQEGQALVLFTLVLVVILLAASIVVDLGLLRNNRQTLVNALDSGALAGGTQLPITGSAAKTRTNNLVAATVLADYPGIPPSAYTITYRCLIGADPATGQPLYSQITAGRLQSHEHPRPCPRRLASRRLHGVRADPIVSMRPRDRRHL